MEQWEQADVSEIPHADGLEAFTDVLHVQGAPGRWQADQPQRQALLRRGDHKVVVAAAIRHQPLPF